MPWTLLIHERVGRGPVPYQHLLAETSALVPPGRAYRRGVEMLAAARRSNGLVPKGDPVDRAIRRGQRQIAMQAMRQMAMNQKIEVYLDEDGVKMVRAGPKR